MGLNKETLWVDNPSESKFFVSNFLFGLTAIEFVSKTIQKIQNVSNFQNISECYES